MLNFALPLAFIFLWSSAFITSKFIVEEATPFIALCFRFAIVSAGYALFALLRGERLRAGALPAAQAVGIGALFHGLYLGGVFYAVSRGMPTGLAALIVTLQPILTAALARPVLGEALSAKQWGGILIGFAGVVIVLGVDLPGALHISAYIMIVVALLSITAGTLWQKKISNALPLAVNNMYQALSATAFHFCAFMLLETDARINFSAQFAVFMGWQIIFVSFGAFTILTYLIKHGSAGKTATLFFLVPGVSAIMAWGVAGEHLSPAGVIGLIISSIGVYIATRPAKAAAV